MAPPTMDLEVREMTTDSVGSEYDDWSYTGCYSPTFKLHLSQELDRLGALPSNWDHEGASPIDPAIIQATRRFIGKLPEGIAKVPSVVPIAEGNLQLEWNAAQRSLELEIADPKTIHYLKWFPEEGIEEESFFPIDDIDLAASLIRWFMRGLTDV